MKCVDKYFMLVESDFISKNVFKISFVMFDVVIVGTISCYDSALDFHRDEIHVKIQ